MKRRRAYRSTDVKEVRVEKVLEELAAGPLWVGLDVGKEEVLAVVRDDAGQFARPWKTKQPRQLRLLVERIVTIGEGRKLIAAMESTGTYGDALRQALTDADVAAHRVSGKATSDYAEIFDGVPSAHDGKDAAVIAELAAIGKSTPWPYQEKSDRDAEIARWVSWLDCPQDVLQMWQGRLEALLTRHWPEATRALKLSSATLMQMLMHYGGPSPLAEDEDASARLASWGGRFLDSAKIRRMVDSAGATTGVRMHPEEVLQMQCYAEEAYQAYRAVQSAKRRLSELSKQHATLARLAEVVGGPTACVLWVAVGDPNNYHCGEAYRKAIGLNLKERSSGKYRGKLKITKRGPAIARRWLYFAAMRILQTPEVRGWYEAKKRRDGDRGRGAVIAVMRKLALALYAVGACGEEFSLARLFPGQ